MIKKMFNLLLTVVCLIKASEAIPSFIKPCSLSDGECMAREGTNTLHALVDGHDGMDIPSLNPLNLDVVVLKGSQIHVTVKDLKVYGVHDGQIKSIKFNPEKRTAQVVYYTASCNLVGDYEAKGTILIVRIDGHGLSNITATGSTITWTFSYDLEERDGKQYLKIVKDEVAYDIKKLHLDFADLFAGNELLTKNTNDLLNEEWQAVLEDMGPGLAEAIGNVMHVITGHLFATFPFDELTKP